MKTLLLKGAKNLIASLFSPDSEKRNKVLSVIIVFIFVIVIVPSSAISLPGILLKDAFNSFIEGSKEISIDEFNFDEQSLSKNDMYIKIRYSYIKYLDSLNYEFDQRVEEIKRTHTYEREIEEIDSKGKKKKRVVKIVPVVIKNISIAKPELRHLMAYIGVKYLNMQTEDANYKFDFIEAQDFLKNITIYNELVSGSDPIYYTVRTTILDIRSIAEKYFTEDIYGDEYKNKQDQYIASFESMEDFKDNLASLAYDYIDIGSLNIHENGMKIPHILQYDPQWGGSSYGDSTIAQSGCAILCMDMVQAYLTETAVNPTRIAEWASSNGYYYPGQGTAWSFFEGYSRTIGVKCTNIGKSTQLIIKALEEGRPIIASMAPGTFTQGGHFIVLRGITKDGKILVNDPNDNFTTKNFYNQEFLFNLIYSEGKNFWSFDRY